MFNDIKPIDMVCRHPLETYRGTICARIYEVVELKTCRRWLEITMTTLHCFKVFHHVARWFTTFFLFCADTGCGSQSPWIQTGDQILTSDMWTDPTFFHSNSKTLHRTSKTPIFFWGPKNYRRYLKWTALKTSIDGLKVVQKFRWPLTGQLQLWWVKVPFLMLIKTYKNPWLELCGFFFLNSKFWNGQTSVHDTSMAKDVVYPGLHLPWCLHGLCPTLVWELGACRIPTCAGKHTLEIKEHSWKLRKRSCEVRVRCTCFVFDIFDFCPITNHLWHPVTVRCEVFTFCFEDRLWSTLYSPDTQQYTCIQRLSNVSGCNLEHRALKWR